MADSRKEDSWIGIYWKPAAAVIYLFICVFDFVVVPTYLGIWTEPLRDLIMAIKDLPPEVQQSIITMKLATWEPLTLKGGGLFHMSFGAILGATVWQRGKERLDELRHSWSTNNPPYQSDPYASDPYANQQNQMTGMVTPPPGFYNGPINNQAQNTGKVQGAQIDNPDENG